MKIKDAWGFHDFHTGKASDVARSLALGALALVWLFKDQNNAIPKLLLWPCALVMIALALDLAQYLVSGAVWYWWIRQKETSELERDPDKELGAAPRWINRPGTILYWLKIAFVAAAYIVLLSWSYGRLFC